ncbi:MAG: hypothetical protein ACK2T3_04445, partial [Candidatus Promineifilaceae bacterium]
MLDDIQTWTIALAILIGSVILSWLVGFVLDLLTRRYFRRTETHLDDVIIGSIKIPVRIAIIVFGLELALKQVDIIADGELQENINNIFFAMYLLIVYVAILRLISSIARWYGDDVASKTETELDDKFLSFFKALANVV